MLTSLLYITLSLIQIKIYDRWNTCYINTNTIYIYIKTLFLKVEEYIVKT